jgi:dimethylargininase
VRLIVRPPGAALVDALSEHPERDLIDVHEARREHAAYVAALRAALVEVVTLPAEEHLPDATFVRDTVLAFPAAGTEGPTALLVAARPGAPSRRPEVPSVVARARELAGPGAAFLEIAEPGTLDGGDVITYGERVAVGVSARTNRAGAEQLASAVEAIGYRAFLCPVTDRLHLASAVAPLGARRLIGTAAGYASLEDGGAETAPPDEIQRLVIPDGEVPAASVLKAGGRCFVVRGHPTALELMRAVGEEVVEVELREFTRADGGPTCLVAPIF